MKPNQTVRILLVDDHKIMRDGLRSVLEKEADFEVVAEAGEGGEAVGLAKKVKPDVVILDVAMPQVNGIEAAKQIRIVHPKARIIALTMHTDKNYLAGMLGAGTVGYLLKDCASEELVQAVRDVIAGKVYFSSDVAPLILEDYADRSVPQERAAEPILTAKEIEVLQWLASGLGTREIAERMEVSGKTIDRYRAQISEKLQLFSVAELTKYAVRKGISPLS